MLNVPSVVEKRLRRQLVFSLALAIFGTSILDVLASLFLADLAKTFLGNSSLLSIAVVSQIVTISSVAAVVFGLLNGFLSVKVNHKSLLLLGVSCIVVGSIGCFFAPSLSYMQIFYPFDGVGTVIVSAMSYALIGESLPLEQRAKSIGIVASAGIFSSALGFVVAGYFGAAGGWRSYLLLYALPISLIAVGLAYFSIPSQRSTSVSIQKASFLDCLKEIMTNKSAAACLFAYTLAGIAAMWAFFAATFWGKQYSISIEYIGIITSVTIVVHAVGSAVGGRLVDSAGRKPLVVASWMARGVLVAAIAVMPNFWSAFVISCLFMFVGGISITSCYSLNLEQVRKSRGMMMSLSVVFAYIGASIGVASGGLVLGTYGFELVAITFGLLNLAAALTILIFAKDPTKASTI